MRLFEPDSGVTHLPPFAQVQAHSRHTIITPPRHTPQESASQVWLARRDMYLQGRVHCSCGCLKSVRGAGRCRMTCPPRESSVVPVRVATHQTHSGSTQFTCALPLRRVLRRRDFSRLCSRMWLLCCKRHFCLSGRCWVRTSDLLLVS